MKRAPVGKSVSCSGQAKGILFSTSEVFLVQGKRRVKQGTRYSCPGPSGLKRPNIGGVGIWKLCSCIFSHLLSRGLILVLSEYGNYVLTYFQSRDT